MTIPSNQTGFSNCANGFDCDLTLAATTNCLQNGQAGPPPPINTPSPGQHYNKPPPASPTGESFGAFLDTLLGNSTSNAASFTGAAGKRDAASSSGLGFDETAPLWSGTTGEDEEFEITTSPSEHELRDLHSRGIQHLTGARITFRNRKTGGGCNLVIPGDICINTPIGHFAEASTGIKHTDGTLGQFFGYYYNPHLRTNLTVFTKRFAETTLKLYQDHVATAAQCHLSPADEGELKLKEREDTYSAKELMGSSTSSDLVKRDSFRINSGFWTAVFLSTVPGFGISFTAFDLGIPAYAKGNITIQQYAALLASVGVIGTLTPVMVSRPDIEAAFGGFEAAVLNFFITIFRNMLQFIKGCFTREMLTTAVSNLRRTTSSLSLLPVFGPFSSSPNTSPAGSGEIELAQAC